MSFTLVVSNKDKLLTRVSHTTGPYLGVTVIAILSDRAREKILIIEYFYLRTTITQSKWPPKLVGI